MSTQSGALGLAILDYARRLDIGISSFVSVGNKADVSGNDLIQYLGRRSRGPSVILLYLESFGNPKKFSEIARRVGAHQADRGGQGGTLDRRSARRRVAYRRAGLQRHGGRRAVPSGRRHPDRAARGAVRRRGAAVASAGSARARGVAILTNAGGPGILAADACEANGLELPPLGEATRAELRSFLPAAASVGNPVDMLASAPPEHYRRALARHPARRRGRQRHRHLHSAARDRARRGGGGDRRGARGRRTASRCSACSCAREGAPAALAPIPCLRLSRIGRARAGAGHRPTGEWRSTADRAGAGARDDSIATDSAGRRSECSRAAAAGDRRTKPARCWPPRASPTARVARRDDRGGGRSRRRAERGLSGRAQGARPDAAAQDRAAGRLPESRGRRRRARRRTRTSRAASAPR